MASSIEMINKLRRFVNNKIQFAYWNRKSLATPRYKLSPSGQFHIRNPNKEPPEPKYFQLLIESSSEVDDDEPEQYDHHYDGLDE